MTTKNKLYLVTCDNYRRELAHLLHAEDFKDVELLIAGLRCGRPGSQWQSLTDVLPPSALDSNVRLLGCACLGADNASSQELCGLRSQPNAHGCYLFTAKELLDRLIREGSYLVTPGWLLHWRQRIREWGFDETTAREYFSESESKIVLLDTGIDPTSNELLAQFAEFVQRPFSRIYVGMDMLRLSLWKLVLEWRLEQQDETAFHRALEAERRKADYATSMDILGELARTHTELETIGKIVELFSVLCAPKEIGFYDARKSVMVSVPQCPEPAADTLSEVQEFIRGGESHRYREPRRGFLLRFANDGETLGALVLNEISFPEFGQHYLNLALAISTVCGLVLRNARIYEELQHTNEDLRTALADVKTLSGLVPICASCKKIRDDRGFWNILEGYIQDRTHAKFSHGICPDCMKQLYPEFVSKRTPGDPRTRCPSSKVHPAKNPP